MKDDSVMCPADAAINLLQEKWVLHIVRILLDGPRGFNDLSRAVGGVNAATLADRLDRLEEMRLVTKTVRSVMPPRTTYTLSPMGIELDGVIQGIDRWARKYLQTIPRGGAEEARPGPAASRPRPHRGAGGRRIPRGHSRLT